MQPAGPVAFRRTAVAGTPTAWEKAAENISAVERGVKSVERRKSKFVPMVDHLPLRREYLNGTFRL